MKQSFAPAGAFCHRRDLGRCPRQCARRRGRTLRRTVIVAHAPGGLKRYRIEAAHTNDGVTTTAKFTRAAYLPPATMPAKH